MMNDGCGNAFMNDFWMDLKVWYKTKATMHIYNHYIHCTSLYIQLKINALYARCILLSIIFLVLKYCFFSPNIFDAKNVQLYCQLFKSMNIQNYGTIDRKTYFYYCRHCFIYDIQFLLLRNQKKIRITKKEST